MCEIFPEVEKCCLGISLRVGMMLISIISIMSGVIFLSVLEKKSNINYGKAQGVTNIQATDQVMSATSVLIPTGMVIVSLIFMFTGVVLFFATLADDEGLVQVFVWLTFLGVLIGFIMVLMTACECLLKPACILSDFDWLSGSALLVLVIAYLFLWIYFITVANSYVIQNTA
ncbi:uncharacterized protein LOC123720202 isoform X1 [Pieris brassicae]|uniref:uncharacterized protein LOC123720202 isoform X1 n=1 Tax=Pieris brassicae TaxID=7116 RepID=UPI001E65E922|nr:uncharacterized protein LOC123720202 isoform X1 [Pieris brassicae]